MIIRALYSLIGCHGITDMSLPYELWGPIYIVSCIYSQIIPYRVLLWITYSLSAFHFAHDIFHFVPFYLRYMGYMIGLGMLLYFRKHRWSQYTILAYLGCIHTPLHLIRYMNHQNNVVVAFTGAFIYANQWIQRYMNAIVTKGEIETTSRKNRLLISVLNAHILVNSMDSMNSMNYL